MRKAKLLVSSDHQTAYQIVITHHMPLIKHKPRCHISFQWCLSPRCNRWSTSVTVILALGPCSSFKIAISFTASSLTSVIYTWTFDRQSRLLLRWSQLRHSSYFLMLVIMACMLRSILSCWNFKMQESLVISWLHRWWFRCVSVKSVECFFVLYLSLIDISF